MDVYKELVTKSTNLAIVGLGYVGMPLAVAFSQKVKVTGFDLNAAKIALYKNGKDPTKEVGDKAVADCTVDFTTDEKKLKKAGLSACCLLIVILPIILIFTIRAANISRSP